MSTFLKRSRNSLYVPGALQLGQVKSTGYFKKGRPFYIFAKNSFPLNKLSNHVYTYNGAKGITVHAPHSLKVEGHVVLLAPNSELDYYMSGGNHKATEWMGTYEVYREVVGIHITAERVPEVWYKIVEGLQVNAGQYPF